MSNKITVRQYTNNDEDIVHRIEQQARNELTSISTILRYYDISDDGFMVSEVDLVVVGFLIFTMRTTKDGNKQGHILSIATDNKNRKHGIGKILIEEMIKKMKKINVYQIALEVKTNNIGAHNFYYQLGFEKVQVIPSYYRMRGYTEDAMSMVLKY